MPTKVASPMATTSTNLLELEKELICSICTETLYQPRTLLDCLHTFCGSCLKEWFTFEYNKARSKSSSSHSNPFTCPTCRAQVKDERHNATVNTLLEMFLAADPSRGKSEQDKADIAKVYKPGENILPKLEHGTGRRSRRREEEERAEEQADRRMIEEARERSMREIRGPSSQSTTHLTAPTTSDRRSSRSRSRESRDSRDNRRRDDDRREERRERRRRLEAAEAELREREQGPDTSSVTPTPIASLTAENLAAARLSPPATSPRHPSAVQARQRERQLVPQTSLRSLVSASENGVGTGDSVEAEQIIQQLISEGLLEGIDLHNLNQEQEELLSDRVAAAYRRRRHPQDQQSNRLSPRNEGRRRTGSPTERTRVRERQQEAERRHHQRSHSAQGTASELRQGIPHNDQRPPSSQSRVLPDGALDTTAHRRHGSEIGTRRPSPPARSQRTNSGNVEPNQATRSATDLSVNPRHTDPSRRSGGHRSSDTRRSNTEPDQPLSVSERWRRAARPDSQPSSTDTQSIANNAPMLASEAEPSSGGAISTVTRAIGATDEQSSRTKYTIQPISVPSLVESQKTPTSINQRSPPLYTGPVVSCAVCLRPSIQVESHKHCLRCSTNVCLRCYRTAQNQIRPCPPLAKEKAVGNGTISRPGNQSHNFIGHKYLRPASNHSATESPSRQDQSTILQEGKFCDICYSFANECYWSCNTCNKGDWGFCNSCVNSHHCCTHPLLPQAHKDFAPKKPTFQQGPNRDSGTIKIPASTLDADVAPPNLQSSRPSSSGSMTAGPVASDPNFVLLTINAHCDICENPIPPTSPRFHCPSHTTAPSPDITTQQTIGDYDICTTCYPNLVKLRKIRKEDGPNGWRRCPLGHRMIVIGFEDVNEGQKRIVIHDLVGGHSLKESPSPASRPPGTGGDVANTATPTGTGTGVGVGPSTQGSVNPASSAGSWSWLDKTDNGSLKREIRPARLRASSNAVKSTPSFSSPPTTSTMNPSISSIPTSSPQQTPSSPPPSATPGLTALAWYPWFPDPGPEGAGELMFPRWAEIREVEEVNRDWYSGVYAGGLGVFPASMVRLSR